MHCHGSRNCCSGPTGSPPLLVSLKIAVLWWCSGDCWENSCPTPPLLLHPSFPLNGAISSNTLGSSPQKSRRLRPITQINWHEWAYPHAASVKEGVRQHVAALLQWYFSRICSDAMREDREGKMQCCPLRFNKRILFYFCAYTRSTTAARNTPMPSIHTDTDTITRWLSPSFQSARPISAAGLVFGSFFSHKGKQLC